jgi:hypothetical protein
VVNAAPGSLPRHHVSTFYTTLVKKSQQANGASELRRTPQPVEKPLYAPSELPSRTQKSRHCSVLTLMSKCLDAVLDYRLVL